MARPRIATQIQEAKGAFKHDPQRRSQREGEPEPNGPVGDPPDYFDDELRSIWFEYVMKAHPGVLCLADSIHLEMACVLTRDFRRGELSGAKLSSLRTMLGQMGMNPSERSKVSASKPKPPADDPLSKLMRGKGVN